MFYEKKIGKSTFFVFRELEKISGFVHAFTSRHGDFSTKDVGPSDSVVGKKEDLLDALGVRADQLAFLEQTHSSEVVTLNHLLAGAGAASSIGPADGVVIRSFAQFAVIRTADCLPILAVAKQHVCLLHAGWRGTRDRIAARGIKQLLKTPGLYPQDVIVAIGPCIRRCCYQVGSEVKAQFKKSGHKVDQFFKEDRLDLVKANIAQIQDLGVTRILDSKMCTACQTDLFYSYRKEATTRRNWVLAGFKLPRTR